MLLSNHLKLALPVCYLISCHYCILDPDEFMNQLVKFQEEDRKLHDLAVRDISILTASKEKLSK